MIYVCQYTVSLYMYYYCVHLIRDIGGVAKALYGDEAPPTVLMGHRYNILCPYYVLYGGTLSLSLSLLPTSMGGAIAMRVAAAALVPSLVGLAVIDVVEGERG